MCVVANREKTKTLTHWQHAESKVRTPDASTMWAQTRTQIWSKYNIFFYSVALVRCMIITLYIYRSLVLGCVDFNESTIALCARVKVIRYDLHGYLHAQKLCSKQGIRKYVATRHTHTHIDEIPADER